MNLLTGESSEQFFGGEVSPAVKRLLDQVEGANPQRVEALLWTAQASSPECLPVYYLLYKFHAGRRQFDLAERAACAALREAARQCGLPQAWQEVQPGSASFGQNGPARFWLFTLKALAFILLRSGRSEEASAALAKIHSLCRDGGLGDDVISALIEGSAPR